MRAALLVIVALLAGCAERDRSKTEVVKRTENITVVKAVTFEGITLYEVYIPWRGVVYVAASEDRLRTTWDEQSGKTTRQVSVETVQR